MILYLWVNVGMPIGMITNVAVSANDIILVLGDLNNVFATIQFFRATMDSIQQTCFCLA
jgi:cation transport ATPase